MSMPLRNPRRLLAALVPLALAGVAGSLLACRIPEHRQEFYSNGTLKERFWVYEGGDGREVMHGLYVAYYPNGRKEVEVLYRDGAEVTKTYYSERGTVQGTVHVATLPEL
jgi:hypothetical protein